MPISLVTTSKLFASLIKTFTKTQFRLEPYQNRVQPRLRWQRSICHLNASNPLLPSLIPSAFSSLKALPSVTSALPTPSTLNNSIAGRILRSVRQQYARAKEKAADKLADEIVEIADNATPQDAHVARLKVDARKWVAAKLLPKKYGDRPAEVNVNTQINLAQISVEDQQRLQRRRQELLKEEDTNTTK